MLATVPEGPPRCFDWRGARQVIVECVGPERLETGWWRGRHVRRDYYRVTCESGRQCWLFRDPDMGKWYYGYDLAGNLVWQTDARGCTTSFIYDELNRLETKSYAGSACGGAGSANYYYDEADTDIARAASLV